MTGWNSSGYSLAVSTDYQDFVVARPVPIPPTVLLLGAGLLGLVGLRRRFTAFLNE
jgi:hypothetical protein